MAEEDVSINTPVVGSHNTYLEDITNSIREKAVPWEVGSLSYKSMIA
jgi:hypothetical protein